MLHGASRRATWAGSTCTEVGPCWEVRATCTVSPASPSTRLHTTCRGFCGLCEMTTSPAIVCLQLSRQLGSTCAMRKPESRKHRNSRAPLINKDQMC